MHGDTTSRSLLHLLQLRWIAVGRTRQPEAATFHEVQRWLDLKPVVLIDFLEQMMVAGLIEPVYVGQRWEEHIAYRVSTMGQQVVMRDRRTQHQARFDAKPAGSARESS